MNKNFKEFLSEGLKGPDTYGRAVKSGVKQLETRLKKDKISYTIREGYNMAWFDFLNISVLIDGENGRNKFKIYRNKRPDMFYGKVENVLNYINSGFDVNKA